MAEAPSMGEPVDPAPGSDGAIHAIAAAALDATQTALLVRLLDQSATVLARSSIARENIGNATSPSIWPILLRLWSQAAQYATNPPLARPLTLTLAKFTRNLVAATPMNQARAFECEPHVRTLLYHSTSFYATQDASGLPKKFSAKLTLSNMVTANDALAAALWTTYLSLPEERNVLTYAFLGHCGRTASSSAPAFALQPPLLVSGPYYTLFRFRPRLNCVNGSVSRMQLLADGAQGPRLSIAMLDQVASLSEAEEASERGQAFDIGSEVFSRAIEAGAGPTLYRSIAVEGEAVAPHQTTFLRLLDSYLHGSQVAHEVALARGPDRDGKCLLDVLVGEFLSLGAYAQRAIHRALGSQDTGGPESHEATPRTPADDGAPAETRMGPNVPGGEPHAAAGASAPLHELDLLLPKVCEALVLVTECITTACLRAEESGATALALSSSADSGGTRTPRNIVAAAASPVGQGFVECLVETLGLVDAFVPRITYGKVVRRPPAPTPRATWTPGQMIAAVAQAFAHVKRDLVRLLGVLAAEDRAVQDRARACGGVPAVMNLCVVDDLTHGNEANQAVVQAIRPVGRWDEDKVLRDIARGTV
ncbi:uncharacterized protein BXZ73DRAFT_98771 [Epithele typhae]|uniref:uncharacterized protein n=1 Tax=Epithele typhae TaxID=378194 RepID=UPI00200751BC|nr:uncharacterized protein BXZ73DRAFT_98771 [Epithele typhae]KAH9940943.1 hypothetical protein BXZ73DRAFT_98771 [Epithele typhae]